MRIAAVLLGAIFYALALPPFDWSVFGWFALVPLILVVREQPTASAFWYGVLGGYAFGWAITWSIAEMGVRYFGLPFPLGVAAFASYYFVVCGIPFGLFAAGIALMSQSRNARRAVGIVPLLWVATEFVRGRVLGQPWGLLGYTQHGHVALIQVAACTGVYGVSFLLALGGTAVAEAVCRWRDGRGLRHAVHAFVLPAVVISACWAGGAACLGTRSPGNGLDREVAVVQTNVSPARHWTRSYTQAQLMAHLRATDSLPAAAHPALIVWPENAVPRYLEAEPMVAVQLADLAVRHRADLLFGGPRFEAGKVYNSARLITAGGRNGGHYDKQRLLLFAEEKPLLPVVTHAPNDTPEEFSPGVKNGVLRSFVPLGVSICHEITHPDVIVRSVRDGAELLVNIANDGWLDAGYEFAGRQHLAMAVFRAVETRRYLVRAATTGTSAVIDPYGRIVDSLPPGTTGVLTTRVAVASTVTPYVRLGDLFVLVCATVTAAALGAPRLVRRDASAAHVSVPA